MVIKKNAIKNTVELLEEREIDLTKAFIGVSLIRNQAEKAQDGNKPDEFLRYDQKVGHTF